MKKVTVIARIRVREDSVQFIKEELKLLIGATHQEKGNIKYEIHQDLEDECVFYALQEWETWNDHAQHMKSPHITRIRDITIDCMEEWEINRVTKLF